LSYTVGLEQVFLNGVNLVRGQDYTATNGTSVGALTALVASDVVEVFAYVPFNIANALTVSTVDAKGDLLVGTAADTVGRLAVGSNGQTLIADSAASTGLKWNTGSILQIVSTTKTDTFSTTSTSFADITGLSVSITPKFSTSKIFVTLFFGTLCQGSAGEQGSINLVRNSTAIAQPDSGSLAGSLQFYTPSPFEPVNGSISFLDSPATTSSTTYKAQIKTTGNTVYVNRRGSGTDVNAVSTITVMEVSA
jgi:hypothetical protein